jgi:hypothetical protein
VSEDVYRLVRVRSISQCIRGMLSQDMAALCACLIVYNRPLVCILVFRINNDLQNQRTNFDRLDLNGSNNLDKANDRQNNRRVGLSGHSGRRVVFHILPDGRQAVVQQKCSEIRLLSPRDCKRRVPFL